MDPLFTSDPNQGAAWTRFTHLQRLLAGTHRERTWFGAALALTAFYVVFLVAAAADRRNVMDVFFSELPDRAAARPAPSLPICVNDPGPVVQLRDIAHVFPAGVFGLSLSRRRLIPGLWMAGARAGVAVNRHELAAGVRVSLRGLAWFDKNQPAITYRLLANDTLLSEGLLKPDAPQLALDLEIPGAVATSRAILIVQLHVPEAPLIPMRAQRPTISLTSLHVTPHGEASCSR